MLCSDVVAGIGSITVDPRFQSHGVGRILMQWAILVPRGYANDEVHRRGIRQTRLFQEAINTTTLSLMLPARTSNLHLPEPF